MAGGSMPAYGLRFKPPRVVRLYRAVFSLPGFVLVGLRPAA